jgi:hypothetical protein
MSFLDYANRDLAAIVGGDFSENLMITNGSVSLGTRGLFDESYKYVSAETHTEVLSEDSRVTLCDSGLAVNIRSRSVIVSVRGIDYAVTEWIDNGDGSVTLYLERKS